MLSRALLVSLVFGVSVGCSTEVARGPAERAGSAAVTDGPGSTATPSPTQTEPTVAPATGPKLTFRRLDEPVLTARLPDDSWRLTSDQLSRLSPRSGETYLIDGFVVTESGEADLQGYVRGQKEIYAAAGRFPERGEDRVVDGVEGLILEESGKRGLLYQYAAQQGKALLTLRFEFSKDSAKSRAWIESVLAGAEWL